MGYLIRLIVIGCSVAAAGCAIANDRPLFDAFDIPAGERTDLVIDVPAGEQDPATFIPVTVLRGQSDGPVVLMVAGVHGYEFSPLLAAQRLADEIKPASLQGALIIVRAAHIPAFENRVPYVNPYDRKNLNRSFPGRADGTQTQRIAHALSSLLIASADFVFDVHSGDGAEWLEAFVGIYGGPLASDYDSALGVANASGFPHVVRYTMNTQEQIDRGRSLNRQAVAAGLPTALLEVGQNGSRRPEDVDKIVRAIRNSLAFLKVTSEPVADMPEPLYFDGTQAVPANVSGLWTPTRHGGPVEKGEVLGSIRDYSGKTVETLLAPVSGIGIYGLAGPPIREGDSVMTIAIPGNIDN